MTGLPGAYIVWLASPESEYLRGKFVWSNWDIDELRQKEAEIKEKNLLTIGLSGWGAQA
jgi:hypothetical protein